MEKIGKRFQGKVAIVTASTQGIGFSIAERIGGEGAAIAISSRKQKNVDEAVEKLRSKGIEVLGVVCHVSNAEHMKNLVGRTVQRKSLEEKTLLNRLGKTEDMAAATASLASDDAAYITGETLKQKPERAIVVAYPSLRRITRSSLERLRSASHCKKFGDESLLFFVMSATVDDFTNGATLAPWPAFTRALNPVRKPSKLRSLNATFHINNTTSGAKTPARAMRTIAFFTATIKKAPTTRAIKRTTRNAHVASFDTLNPSFVDSLNLVTAAPYCTLVDGTAGGSRWPERRPAPAPNGPEVMSPVG
nr:tropinone reductase-like 3 [Ipomoea batatas]